MSVQPIKFACDALPDCQGQIVESTGNFVVIEGLAQDSGAWFVKGVGGARRFGTRQEAADYIEYAQPKMGIDAEPFKGPFKGFSVGDLVKIREGGEGIIESLGDNGAVIKGRGYWNYGDLWKGNRPKAPGKGSEFSGKYYNK